MGLRKKQDNDGWTLASESNKPERYLFFKNSIDPFTKKKEPKKLSEPKYFYKYEDRIGKLIKQQAACGVAMATCGVLLTTLSITWDKLQWFPTGMFATTLGVLMTAYELHRLKEHKKDIQIQKNVRQRIR